MNHRQRSSLVLLLSTLIIAACSHSANNRKVAAQEQAVESDATVEKDEKDIKISFISEQKRLEALKKAELVHTTTATKMQTIDIIKGPDQESKKKNAFEFNDRVYCRFTTPGEKMGGRTPKFKCIIEKIERTVIAADGSSSVVSIPVKPNDEVKIKFKPDGKQNKELHAEVAATRLFWAMGFYADAVYPVMLTCLGCPTNPVKAASSENPLREVYDFGVASIERKHPGEKLENKEDQGWRWEELSMNTKNATATKDALLLLAAFVGHGDAKPPQQRLVCPKKKIEVDAEFEYADCKKPKMFVQDLGATFGGAGNLTPETAKMDLKHWYHDEDKSIWKKAEKCEARLNTSFTAKGAIENPEISEEGRRYLGALLCKLSKKQIRDLFVSARVESLGEDADTDSKNYDKWVDTFLLKRQQIVANQNCQWKKESKERAVFNEETCQAIYTKFHPNEAK